jgi:hypothetical protein
VRIARCSSLPSGTATSTSITSAPGPGSQPSAAGVEPLHRVYDLRHTFATFALRAGISTFDLSRFMGASLTMIDCHYGHLALDGREHVTALLDSLAADEATAAAWTLGGRRDGQP